MKLYYLTDEALETLRLNIKTNLKYYNSSSNDWIYNFFDGTNPFQEFRYEVNRITLKIDQNNQASADLENIKNIYENLKFLTEEQACDERLWVGLAHSEFWEYMIERNRHNGKTFTESEVKNKFFFNYGKRKSLLVHPIAKLWWTGRNTYDENRENPYELTDFFGTNYYHNNLILFQYNYSNNKNIVTAFIEAMLEMQNNGDKVSTHIFDETAKYLNLISGIYLLDYFEIDELKIKILRKVKELLLNENKNND